MRRLIVVLVLLAAGWIAAPGTAAQAPAAVNGQDVQYPSGGAMIDAYLVRPAGGGTRPAVLLVHDDLGLNAQMRALARRYAEAGFVTLAPHLPSRAKAAAIDVRDGRPPRPAVNGLNYLQTIQDVRSGLTFLQADSSVDQAKISAVGIGWGEYRVWRLAETAAGLYRAVVFYGVTPTDEDQVTATRIPVLGHYAQYDYLIAVRVIKTKQLLGDKFTYYIYPTVPGFMGVGTGQLQAPTGGSVISLPSAIPKASVADAAKLAWDRTLAFLK